MWPHSVPAWQKPGEAIKGKKEKGKEILFEQVAGGRKTVRGSAEGLEETDNMILEEWRVPREKDQGFYLIKRKFRSKQCLQKRNREEDRGQ